MNIWDYFLIRLKRQSKEKLIFYLRTSARPLVKEYELRWVFFSLRPLSLHSCATSFRIDISLELHLIVDFFALHIYTFFAQPYIYVLRSYFRHLFFFLCCCCWCSFTFRCCFVVKITLVYCSWQTCWNDMHPQWFYEQKIARSSNNPTMCLLIALTLAMHILAELKRQWRCTFKVICLKRTNVSTILPIGLISKS